MLIGLTPASLTEQVAHRLLDLPDSVPIAVSFLRPANHTWRLDAPGGTYFVKAHTKDWYTGSDSVAGAVRHERDAHRILARAGLPTPTVITAELGTNNPLGWPHLITRGLPGQSLPQILASEPDGERDSALRAAGRHLRRMHEVEFDHPGYLSESGPPILTDPRGWQHPIWRFERFLQSSVSVWADDRRTLSPDIMDTAMRLFADTLPTLRASFDPPRFTHGDCHANGIFLDRREDGWDVTGVLDLEVASAANPAFDLNKLIIELVGRRRLERYDWWTPLIDGYGVAPDFNLTRLLLISASHGNYTCLDQPWDLGRGAIVEHVLQSTTWSQLFRPRNGRA